MGSFSKPKQQPMVSMPQVIYIPAPSYGAVDAPTPDAGAVPDADIKKVEESVRARKLPETVFTSYRGVLQEGEWVPQRKSLLGE